MAALVFRHVRVGIYGGYFTAAQGIMLIAAMSALLPEDMQRMNAAKNLLSLFGQHRGPWRTPSSHSTGSAGRRRGLMRRVRYSVDSSVRITGGGCRLPRCARRL